MPKFELTGKVAVVTGAARGIGFGTAQALARRGAAVVVVDLDSGAPGARRLNFPVRRSVWRPTSPTAEPRSV